VNGLTRRELLRAVAAAGAGAALGAACEPGAAPAGGSPPVTGGAAGPDTVVTSGVADVQTLNPILSNDGSSQVAWELMFESLVVPDPKTGNPAPWLAERWDQSSDGLTYTFKLRSNVTWHDGRPFTADDVKFTFDAILDPKVQTALRSRLDAVASTDAPDPLTFRMRLKGSSCPTLINAMVTPIVPKHLLAGSSDFNKDAFGTSRPVGTGPFTFVEWVKDDHVTLTANPSYWHGKAKIGRWIRKVVKDNTVAAAQLRSGELDWAIVQPESFDDLKAEARLNVLRYGNSTINYIAYNLDRPLFQDKRIRQALTYALDRASIIKTLFNGQGEVLHSPILTFSWAYDPNVRQYPFDPERAKQLLAEAGWTAGAGGALQKAGVPLRFAIATNAGNKAREGVLTIAQDQWRKVGADAQQQLLQLNALNEKLQRTHDFDAVVGQLVPGVDPDQTSFWSSKEYPGGQNFGHYSSPAADALLEQGRTLAGCDQTARKAIYDRLQATLMDDLPVTLLYQPVTLIAHDRRLRGIAPTVYARPQWNLAEWSWGA